MKHVSKVYSSLTTGFYLKEALIQKSSEVFIDLTPVVLVTSIRCNT